ncbi:MAG: outer membrane protein assembly factor BamB family protein [Planctomycetota bacterium]
MHPSHPAPRGTPSARGATAAVLASAFALAASGRVARPDDRPQWGERYTRNMVSPEKGLPEGFDPATGRNVLWSASLGNGAYGSPVVARGRVLVGATNAEPRDPRHQGDRAILLSLDETTGNLVWQLVVPRTGGDPFLDWPHVSMCSPPTVEGDRVYTLTNRFELVSLDLDGQADGNDGPFLDEGRHMAPAGEPPLEVTPIDADIVWLLDLPRDVGIHPHDGAHASILLLGRYLYLNTCNGVDNTHVTIRKPDAPSLIAVDKETGRLAARDGERIGPRIFHSTWSSPACGEVGGERRIFFCGGDGVVYAFLALPEDQPPPAEPATLRRVWRFDPDPTAPKEDVHRYHQNRRESPSNVKSMPVFYKDRIYVTVGGDIWWGKNKAWLKCADARGSGDVTEKALLWEVELEKHCSSTPSISNGLVFVADCGGKVHCVDAETGTRYWTHPAGREIWGSTLVADGKVYVGSLDGNFCVLAAEREKRLLGSVELGAPMAATPVAANGVLYVTTLRRIYATREAR